MSLDDDVLAVNESKAANIVFTMEATFANKCCEFRQQARGQMLTGEPANGNSANTWGDDNYSREKDPGSYRDNPDGTVRFFDFDNAGAGPAGVKDLYDRGQRKFSMWLYYKGYVVDVCNGGRRVGPFRDYGFRASGSYGGIKVTTWGFDKD